MTGENPRRRRLALALVALGAPAIAATLALAVLRGSGSDTRRPTTSTRASATVTSSTTTPPSTSTTTTPPTSPPPPAPARPAPATEELGASVNVLFNTSGHSPQQIAAQLQALRAAGAMIARSDALWEASEPNAPVGTVHTFAWTFDDRIAGDLAAHHLPWLPILGYSAPWAQSIPGRDHSPPSSSADYAAYAGAFAARYGPAGAFWRAHPGLAAEPVGTYEIWNEPDSGEFWAPVPDAARYGDLYIAARAAIDAADPSARVIVGGLTNPTSFLPAMLAARPQLRGHIDGVAVHPYGTPRVALARIRSARATLDALGMSAVPLYATEFGWTTSPPAAPDYVPAGLRPAYISQTVTALGHLDCGLAASVLYTWYSPQQNPNDRQQWYGIDSLTGAPTAATDAFADGLRRARAPAVTLRICG